MSSARRGLPCSLAAPLPASVLSLLADFRLLVNLGVREALQQNQTARGSLVPLAQRLAREHRIGFSHVRLAMDKELSLTKGHRRRLRLHRASSVPYVRKRFLAADDDTFHLDPVSGHVRLSLRPGEWAGFDLRLSDYHRSRLAKAKIKQLILREDRAILILEPEIPAPFVPTSLLAFDTNERSLDGVWVRPDRSPTPVNVPYPEVATIQRRHQTRRRRLGKKKAHDRRMGRKLGGREGRRERHRVKQRLHALSKGLIELAARRKAALAIEDLHVPAWLGKTRRSRRRLSSWPQGELHRQLLYKAEQRGVPIIRVNPAYTSRSCPRCGVRKERRTRMGTMFRCGACGWRCDRQVNAGLNIGRTALAEPPEGARTPGLGGLVLAPDALARDGLRLLYSPGRAGAHGRTGRSGRVGVSRATSP